MAKTVHIELTDTPKVRIKGAGEQVKSPAPTVMPDEPVKVKVPTDKQRTKEDARYAKRRATERWVRGEITTESHNSIHARADHVLRGKRVREFRGKSGENKGKGFY